jgi:hypothetical protein
MVGVINGNVYECCLLLLATSRLIKTTIAANGPQPRLQLFPKAWNQTNLLPLQIPESLTAGWMNRTLPVDRVLDNYHMSKNAKYILPVPLWGYLTFYSEDPN